MNLIVSHLKDGDSWIVPQPGCQIIHMAINLEPTTLIFCPYKLSTWDLASSKYQGHDKMK